MEQMIESLLTTFYGLKDDPYIHVFVWFVLFDVLTGLAKAVKLGKANSTVGINGLIRHILVVMLVLLMSTYMPVLGYNRERILAVVYFTIMYAISIIENAGEIGLNLPKALTDRIYKLKHQYDDDEIKIEDIKSFKVDHKGKK